MRTLFLKFFHWVRIGLFIPFTWGLVLGLPVACYFALRRWMPTAHFAFALAAAAGLFCIGICLAEWLARMVNSVLFWRELRQSDHCDDNAT
jgi:hypothetical protein